MRRAAAIVFALVTAAMAMPAAHASSRSKAPGLPWLTVAHPANARPVIVDPQGRTVILHGVNVVGVEDDFYTTASGQAPGPAPLWPIDPTAYAGTCPPMNHAAGEPPICEVDAGASEFAQSAAPGSHNDLAQIRALGFNFIRLPVSWSQLEPSPGRYSRTYVDRIAQVVGWAREQGIYVLLDMHQDAYSRFTPENAPVNAPPLVSATQEGANHADGAPPWAVVADGLPAEAPNGQAEFNAYVAAAFDSFWLDRVPPADPNGPGLQEHYIGAMTALARRFANDSTVVGYEIMNEPLPGTIPPVAFSTTHLFPFYAKAITALTKAGVTRQSFFFEPMALRNTEDAPDQIPAPFTSYPNLVYSPHTYTHVFTADALAGGKNSPYPTSYDQAYQVADAEAKQFHAALVPTEYGNAATDDTTILGPEVAAQEKALAGSALWAWKGSCGVGSSAASCAGIWAVYSADPASSPAENLAPIPSRVEYLSRAYPMATAGVLQSYSYDPTRRAFALTAVAAHAGGAPTVIFVPAAVAGNMTVTGAARILTITKEPDGTERLNVLPDAAGSYTVTIG